MILISILNNMSLFSPLSILPVLGFRSISNVSKPNKGDEGNKHEEGKKQDTLRKLTSLISRYGGMFMITQVNAKDNPRWGFMYIDLATNKIIKHKEHKGKHYYKEYITFIEETILSLDKSNNKKILAPKFFINKTLISRVEKLHGIKIEGYTKKDNKYLNVVNYVKNTIRPVFKYN